MASTTPALRVYDAAGWRFANCHSSWNDRGFLLTQWGRLAEAIMSFDRALSLDADYIGSRSKERATRSRSSGPVGDAEVVYRTVLARDPGNANSWNNLGNCLKAAGDVDNARDAYELARSHEPEHEDALFNLAHIDDEYARSRAGDSRRTNPDEAVVAEMLPPIEVAQRQVGVPRMGSRSDRAGACCRPRASIPAVASADGRQPTTVPVVHVDHDRSAFTDESHEFDIWLDALAGSLFSVGYDMVFDRDPRNFDKGLSSLDVLLRMNDCTFFVPIVSEEHAARVAPDSQKRFGWAVTEWDHACRLAERGYLRFIGIWYSGSVLPPPLVLDECVDLREDGNPWGDRMRAVFPKTVEGEHALVRPRHPPTGRPTRRPGRRTFLVNAPPIGQGPGRNFFLYASKSHPGWSLSPSRNRSAALRPLSYNFVEVSLSRSKSVGTNTESVHEDRASQYIRVVDVDRVVPTGHGAQESFRQRDRSLDLETLALEVRRLRRELDPERGPTRRLIVASIEHGDREVRQHAAVDEPALLVVGRVAHDSRLVEEGNRHAGAHRIRDHHLLRGRPVELRGVPGQTPQQSLRDVRRHHDELEVLFRRKRAVAVLARRSLKLWTPCAASCSDTQLWRYFPS